MDSNFQKCTFLAFLSIALCPCSLLSVALLGIELSPINIVEQGMRSVVCLPREVLPLTLNGALEHAAQIEISSALLPVLCFVWVLIYLCRYFHQVSDHHIG